MVRLSPVSMYMPTSFRIIAAFIIMSAEPCRADIACAALATMTGSVTGFARTVGDRPGEIMDSSKLHMVRWVSMPPCGQWNFSRLEQGSVPEFTLTEENNGQSIEVHLGARLNIYLKENPTTGYRWSLREFGSGSLLLESADYAPSGAGVGGGGIRKFV